MPGMGEGFESGRPPPLDRLRSSSMASEYGSGLIQSSITIDASSPYADGELRVAIFAPAYATGEGSSALFVRDLVRFFRSQRGVHCLVFTVDPKRAYASTSHDDVLTEPGAVYAPGVGLPFMDENDYRFCPGLGGQHLLELEHFRPDVIHLTEPCILSLHALQWARARKVPVVASLHGELHSQLRALALSSGPPGAVLLFMYERYLHNFHCQVPRIFVPSAQLQLELWGAGYGERGVNEVEVCGTACDPARFTPAARSQAVRAALGARDDATVLVLWLGPATQEAGADVWAYVLSRLHADGAPVAGVVVGAGDAPHALQDALPRLSVTVANDELQRRGSVDGSDGGSTTPLTPGEAADRAENATAGCARRRSAARSMPTVSAPLEEILASCDVLLCPAMADPFCTHLLRALASGLAVVVDADAASRLGEVGVIDVHSALIALPGAATDVDGCYAATSVLVRDRALGERLRRAGRRAVLRACAGALSPAASPSLVAAPPPAAAGGWRSAHAHAPFSPPPASSAPASGFLDSWAAHHVRFLGHYRESAELGRLRPPRPLRLERTLHNVYWLCVCALFSSCAKTLHELRARTRAPRASAAARLAARGAHAALVLLLPLPLLLGCLCYVPTLLAMQLAWVVEQCAPQSRAAPPPNQASPAELARAARGLTSGGGGVLAALLGAARAAVHAPARRLPSSASLPESLAAAGAAGGAGALRHSSVARARLRRARGALGGCVAVCVGLYLALVVVLHAHTSRHRWQPHLFWCHDVRGVCERRIPFLIHQMYKNEALPEAWAETPATWQRMNPGYKYMLWTDRELQGLIEKHYPWFLPTYLGYPHNIQRSDASRYFLLHRYGGVYADLDIVSTRSIDRLIAGARRALSPLRPRSSARLAPRSCCLSAFFRARSR
jgi:glycosyltransferase involved in cell wall biosynthesis